MSIIRNIKELKDAIKELPDDMEVSGYDGSDQERLISYWVQDSEKDIKDSMDEEEFNEMYPDGCKPFFVLSTD